MEFRTGFERGPAAAAAPVALAEEDVMPSFGDADNLAYAASVWEQMEG